jgi:transcriptional regulator with XRE-family HTH domain
MPIFNATLLISELRKAKNLSQAKLAEGICSRETIVKIEKGERKPDWWTLKNLMMRLEVNPENFVSDIASEDEMYVINKCNECSAYMTSFNFEALKNEIDTLANDERFAKSRDGSLLLRLRANLHLQGPYKDSKLAVQYILEYIKLQRPDFDVNNIADYFLSPDEYQMINLLAIVYRDLYGIPEALVIWRGLKANYERSHTVNLGVNESYTVLLSNIALALKHMESYEECLLAVDEGMTQALKYHDMRAYSRYLHQRAWCLLKLGNKEEGEEAYKKFLMFAYVLDGYAGIDFKTVKKEYEDVFGGKLELAVEW